MATDELWDRHVFVCCNQRESSHPRGSCGESRGNEIRTWFQDAIKRHGLAQVVRANKSGCLEACEAGPAVVVYPDAVWYKVQNVDDVERIVAEHLAGGTPVDALRADLTVLPAWKARAARGTSG